MALYDRDYAAERSVGTSLSASRVSFLKKTYQLLALSMIVAAMGAYLTMPFAAAVIKYRWFIFGAELLVLFFGLSLSRGKPGLNLIMLFTFTFLTGVSLVPLLAMLIGAGKLLIRPPTESSFLPWLCIALSLFLIRFWWKNAIGGQQVTS